MSKYRNTTNGKWSTESLVYEIAYSKDAEWTMRSGDLTLEDGRVIKSLKDAYMECMDPTEYSFALKHTGGWEHWKAMQKSKKIMAFIEQWREELSIKLESLGVSQMVNHALDDNMKAAEWLAKRGWEVQSRRAGRPTKEEKDRELKVATEAEKQLNSDANRILHLVKKGK